MIKVRFISVNFELVDGRKSIFILVSLGFISAQEPITVNCVYFIFQSEYTCLLEGIEVTTPGSNVTFAGVHLEGRTEADVEVVLIEYSNTPFMIPQLFTTFPNINELVIEFSNLQSIDVPDTVRLEYLVLFYNNVTKLESGTLRNQSRLTYLEVIHNNIQEIEEDFFNDIPNTYYVELTNNRLTALAPRTFASLRYVIYIDLKDNQLATLEADLFSSNGILRSLYLERNQISEIHNDFVNSLPINLSFVNLSLNLCVNGVFQLGNGESRRLANHALNQCFRNFHRISAELKSITMQIPPNVKFYDEFGNEIFIS